MSEGRRAHRACRATQAEHNAPASLSAASLRPSMSPLLVMPTARTPGSALSCAVSSTKSARGRADGQKAVKDQSRAGRPSGCVAPATQHTDWRVAQPPLPHLYAASVRRPSAGSCPRHRRQTAAPAPGKGQGPCQHMWLLARAAGSGRPASRSHHAHHFLRAQQLGAGREVHPFFRHAIQAAQIAALGKADAQVCVHAPASQQGEASAAVRGGATAQTSTSDRAWLAAAGACRAAPKCICQHALRR